MVMLSSETGDGAKKLFAKLEGENGTPMKVQRGVEPGGIEKLKLLSEKMNRGGRKTSS